MSRSDTQVSTRLEGHSNLPSDRIHDLARETAEGLKSGGMRLEDTGFDGDGALQFAFKSTGLGYGLRGLSATGTQGGLSVFVGDEGMDAPSGQRAILVHLDGRTRTSQQALFGFIPITPKSVVGFGLFKAYLERLTTALRIADPEGEFRLEVGDM